MLATATPNIDNNRTLKAWLIFLPLLAASVVLHYASGNNSQWLMDLALLLVPEELLRQWVMGYTSRELDLGRATVSDRFEPLLVGLFWIASSWGLGTALIWKLPWRGAITRLERRVLEFGVGLGGSSLLVLAFGLAGTLSPWLFRAIVALGIGAGVYLGRRPLPDGEQPDPTQPNEISLRSRWILIPFFFLLAVLAWTALLPPWEFDVMEYHLQAPKEWLQLGRITFLPHNVYANMPLGAELHALATMTLARSPDSWFLGALAGKLVMASFAPLTAFGLYAAGRRWLSPTAGALAALIFLTIPWVLKNATIGHNEVVLGSFGFLSLYCTLRWMELVDGGSEEPQDAEEADSSSRNDQQQAALAWLLTAGWLLGCAVACKYTAIGFFALPLGCVVVFWRKRLRWAAAGILIAASLLAGGLWYAKNAVFTGNPVYPMAYQWFGGRTWNEEKDSRWRSAHLAQGHSPSQFAKSIGQVAWGAPEQSVLVAPLLLLAITPWGWPQQANAGSLWRFLLAMLAVAFLIWWSATHRLPRFLLPFAPLAALLAGGAASRLRSAKESWSGPLLAFVFAMVSLTAILAAVSGRLGEFRLLTPLVELRYDPSLARVHPAHLMLNRADIVPPGKRVLLVAEAQAFNFEVDILYSTCFDDTALEPLVRATSADARLQAFRDANISHVFVHWGELRRYRSDEASYGYPKFVTPELFAELQQQGVLKQIPILTPGGQVDDSSSLFEVQ